MSPLAPLVALALGAATPCTLPPQKAAQPPWRPGEALTYDVDVMGVVKAGTLTATVEDPMFGGTVVPLRVRMRNTSVFAQMRKVRAIATAWVDARTLRPQRYRDETEEDGVHRTTDVRLDRGGPKVAMAWTIGERKGVKEFDRQGDVVDIVSAVFWLRGADLPPGREFCFDVVANRRYWRLQGKLASKPERVETPAGPFEAVRLDATLTRFATPDDPRVRSRPMHLWFSADERRIPIAGVSEVDLGPVRAVLARGASPRPRGEP
jgi:hypothetical protein